jgi:hypothetical protein
MPIPNKGKEEASGWELCDQIDEELQYTLEISA